MLRNGSARSSLRFRPNLHLLRRAIPTPRQPLSIALQNRCSPASGTFTSNVVSRNVTVSDVISAWSKASSLLAEQEVEIGVDTIYALSTGVGARAGIAIVRISGPACLQVSFYNHQFSESIVRCLWASKVSDFTRIHVSVCVQLLKISRFTAHFALPKHLRNPAMLPFECCTIHPTIKLSLIRTL